RAAPICGLLAMLLFSGEVFGQSELPEVSNLQITGSSAVGRSRLPALTGTVQVVVRLNDQPLAAVVGDNAKRVGFQLNAQQQREYLATLTQRQDVLMQSVTALGGQELARLTRAYNAVVVSIDASRLPAIAALPNVATIRPVVDYDLSLSTTVPYVG